MFFGFRCSSFYSYGYYEKESIFDNIHIYGRMQNTATLTTDGISVLPTPSKLVIMPSFELKAHKHTIAFRYS